MENISNSSLNSNDYLDFNKLTFDKEDERPKQDDLLTNNGKSKEDDPSLKEWSFHPNHPKDLIIGLQIKQTNEGIFINQAKYTKELLKKFGMDTATTHDTPCT